MKRGIVARSLAALLAIFFASGTVLPALGDPCPVHDPGTAQLEMMGHAGYSGGAMTHQAEHSSHGDRSAPANHRSHHCHCIGDACSTASVMLPPNALSFAPANISAGSAAPLASAQTLGRGAAEHALPFSTAPPLLEV
jgi:hypothetical protein